MQKLKSAQDGNSQNFDEQNEILYKLAIEKDHAPSMHLMAKEAYKAGVNMLSGKYRKKREETMNLSFNLFMGCIEKNFYHSYYYAAEMLEKGDTEIGVD